MELADGTTPPCDVSDSLSSVLAADAAALNLPSRLEWVEKTIDFLRQRLLACGAYAPGRIEGLALALHEALVNAIVHGNLGVDSDLKADGDDTFARVLAERSADPTFAQRRVSLEYRHLGNECVITITDEGDGFDHADWIATLDADEQLDAPSLRPSGRGILMMRALSDGVEYRHGGRQVIVRLRSGSEERRQAPRIPWSQEIQILPLGEDGQADPARGWTAAGRDLSSGGAAFLQNLRNIPVGSEPADLSLSGKVLVQVEDPITHQPTYIPAEICRATALDGGLLEIGCRFTGEPVTPGDVTDAASAPSPPESVRRVLERLQVAPGQHERRAHARMPYSARVELRIDDEPPRIAFSRDLSLGGMALVASFELPRGRIELRLPPDAAGDDDRAVIQARVVRCQRVTAGVFDIGVQFI